MRCRYHLMIWLFYRIFNRTIDNCFIVIWFIWFSAFYCSFYHFIWIVRIISIWSRWVCLCSRLRRFFHSFFVIEIWIAILGGLSGSILKKRYCKNMIIHLLSLCVLNGHIKVFILLLNGANVMCIDMWRLLIVFSSIIVGVALKAVCCLFLCCHLVICCIYSVLMLICYFCFIFNYFYYYHYPT